MIENPHTQPAQILTNPETLINEFPLHNKAENTVNNARNTINQIINGIDPRLLVIVGPCSIHDRESAMEYATLLATASKQFEDSLFIVMRLYFEKPRTTMGWRGLICDPFLDGSFNINNGLRLARKLLLDINNLGIAAATEFLDPLISEYLQDLVSWCAIGARTSESQLHRKLASSLTMPVGFKNSTDGNIQTAVDAVLVASESHPYLTINQQGTAIIKHTHGNKNCHIVLRGSHSGPNYSQKDVDHAIMLLKNAKLKTNLVIDCSHGNSMKNHLLQMNTVEAIAQQLKNNSSAIRGVMIESNLIAGKQSLQNKKALIYGLSITDSCLGWNETMDCLKILANSVGSIDN